MKNELIRPPSPELETKDYYQEFQILSSLFQRYDLDESGHINTKEELEQLTTNAFFKLEPSMSEHRLEEAIAARAPTIESDPMTCPEFIKWWGDITGGGMPWA